MCGILHFPLLYFCEVVKHLQLKKSLGAEIYFIATWQPLFVLCQQQEFWLRVNQLSDTDTAEESYLDFLRFPFLLTPYCFFFFSVRHLYPRFLYLKILILL